MKATKLIAAVALFAATTGAAFAQQAEFTPADAGFQSTKTRAEVRAEVVQAYKDGTLVTNDGINVNSTALAHAGERTRAEVRAEQAAAPHQSNLNPRDTYFGA
ncbi:MAG: hypothetical protein JWR21_242 [Herminiimonas sp.]|nr:hypothetical protein [Herminiimonas sp.]MDB5852654.1 hypothetical protein [Herminiimonas sp.]